MADPGKLEPDPIIEKLLKRADASSGLAMLVGILGQSPRGTDYWRFYLTPQLDEYVDVRASDVAPDATPDATPSDVFSRPIPNDTSPLARIAVWLPADAEVYYTRVDSRSLQASFLQGEIARAYAPQPWETLARSAGCQPRVTLDIQCSTWSQGCFSHCCWPWG